ncbi:hypothetical protein F5876DRAFT_52620 [Lentinula aff. lateritia]|uniref:Uncharacterized protein n=1 Tax=Lentinula aff. lateritia TaxID=2804960 RepID=A0ACC1TJP0_9AGAR|nr:hypothetical protein F5876DRAFT_52620 [Lentinula aff. lateritia]
MEDVLYWKELCRFFKTSAFPACLTTDNSRLRFRKGSQQFFLQDDRLWLAPKLKSDRLPRLVIELPEKCKYLMAQAHNECGHRG